MRVIIHPKYKCGQLVRVLKNDGWGVIARIRSLELNNFFMTDDAPCKAEFIYNCEDCNSFENFTCTQDQITASYEKVNNSECTNNGLN